MKKVTLTLKDVLNLEVELNGAVNQQTGQKVVDGILNEKLSLILKYHLERVIKQIADHKKHVETLREELIKKYGTETENEGWSIPTYIDEVKDENSQVISAKINPAYIKFNDEFSKLLDEKVEIEIKELNINKFENIETKIHPAILFSLLEDNNEDNA
jgi:hypothetical protein